ncbi:MAG: hypothetical protein HWQ44_13265 [Nostoc sp. JL34]|uniref:hypothetical protein n=1 Tax=Nostoc sp. JL34 TaxID=2815397 RepID=UPI001D69F3CC|nr:hypothetical protein [Nostoc sp. JL34]MBN3883907.1 hypothetical protein [Nostoc sp. JL34]
MYYNLSHLLVATLKTQRSLKQYHSSRRISTTPVALHLFTDAAVLQVLENVRIRCYSMALFFRHLDRSSSITLAFGTILDIPKAVFWRGENL